jgi:hypothetical protein
VIATVLVASVGAGQMTLREAVLCSVCLAFGVAVLFVAVLGQPFMLLRGWR